MLRPRVEPQIEELSSFAIDKRNAPEYRDQLEDIHIANQKVNKKPI